jgi:Protein of unknown function (DUF3631)
MDSDPELPPELHDRAADNWRPLVAIADACGREWRRRTRGAALALSAVLQHEDPGVILLEDIGEVFDARGDGKGAAVLRHQTLSFASSSDSRSRVRPARSLVWRSEGRVRNQVRVLAAVSRGDR